MTTSLRVGLIGLGAMGIGMATSIAKAGIAIKGFDVRAEAAQPLIGAGGAAATTVAAAATDVDLLIIVVVNAEQAEDVLFGAGNAAATLAAGSMVMLCSTVNPAYARQMAVRLEARNLGYLDAPISGGPIRSAAGELSIMLAAPQDLVDRIQPVLDATAQHVHYMGAEAGLGSTMKIINQLLAGVNLAVTSEAIAFGARAGVDPQKIYDVITTSAGNSWMFENRAPHIIADDYTPASAIDIWVKDLDIVLQTGKDLRLPLFLSAAAHQLFMAASSAGYGRLDDAALVKVFEKLADFSVLSD